MWATTTAPATDEARDQGSNSSETTEAGTKDSSGRLDAGLDGGHHEAGEPRRSERSARHCTDRWIRVEESLTGEIILNLNDFNITQYRK